MAASVAKIATTTAVTAEKTLEVTTSTSPIAPPPPIATNIAPALASPVTSTVTSPLVFLNNIVAGVLNPFLKPAPGTPEPFTPVIWAVLGWVRRNLFNQGPTIHYNPTVTTQTEQTVTGNIGATDPEGDPLTYKITQQPQHGTVTIDQATGNFSYTPDDINYSAAQTDSFTVSVTDGKTNLLSVFGASHSAQTSIDVLVLSPQVQRTILNLPTGVTSPASPRFSGDGQSIYFHATAAGDPRTEIYRINVDGTGLTCLTCGVTTSITDNLNKPIAFEDGSGRVLVRVTPTTGTYRYAILEQGPTGSQLVPVITPPGAGFAVDPNREGRISPDGTHILFSRIELGQNNYAAIVPIVGDLNRTTNATTGAPEYHIDNAKVVYPTGEGKQWTPDGKGVIILGGQDDAGNVDDIEVDLATGKVTRVTTNLDYDEDIDESPNEQWIAVGSTRGLNALTPMSRIQRPGFLPAYIVGPVYTAYATGVNVSNQEWVVANEDELKGEKGIPLFVNGDGYAARSMPSWNADGTAVTFWESNKDNPSDSRIVIANVKYTTSVGPVAGGDTSTPALSSSFPDLKTYVPGTPPLPPTGTYTGAGGGTAVVTEAADPAQAGHTIRTVTYTNYVNRDGEILNGTESTNTTGTQLSIHYTADITVTGTHTGYLQADAQIANRQTLTGYITSDIDGDVQTINDPANITAAQQGV